MHGSNPARGLKNTLVSLMVRHLYSVTVYRHFFCPYNIGDSPMTPLFRDYNLPCWSICKASKSVKISVNFCPYNVMVSI